MQSLLCIWVDLLQQEDILFDNEQNKSTGGQNTYQSHVDYVSIAKASGLEILDNMDDLSDTKCVKFLYIKCGTDDETPRPPIEVVKVNQF